MSIDRKRRLAAAFQKLSPRQRDIIQLAYFEGLSQSEMAARLQAATSGSEPILLRITSGGHGIGGSLDETVDRLTDVYTFIFDRLGLDYRGAA